MMRPGLVVALCLLLAAGNASAALVFGLVDKSELCEQTSASLRCGGVNAIVSATAPINATLESSSTGFGLSANCSCPRDLADRINPGEALSIRFDRDVYLESVEASGFGVLGGAGVLMIGPIGSFEAPFTRVIDAPGLHDLDSQLIRTTDELRLLGQRGTFSFDSFTVSAVPEPGTALAMAGLGLLLRRRARR